MNRAEKFILENTNDCYNYNSYAQDPIPWLTPDQARKAVEIAREETYDKIRHWLAYHINDYVVEGKGRDIDFIFDDIKQAMKDE